jgi:hypothetical protein
MPRLSPAASTGISVGRSAEYDNRAEFAAQDVYLGGGATIPSHRRRGAMSSLIASAWLEAPHAPAYCAPGDPRAREAGQREIGGDGSGSIVVVASTVPGASTAPSPI